MRATGLQGVMGGRKVRTTIPDPAAAYAEAGLRAWPKPQVGNPVLALLAPRYCRTSLTIWFTAFLSLFCIPGLTGWPPKVIMRRSETFAASFGFGALMQVVPFVGGLALAMLADWRPGRRCGCSRHGGASAGCR